jgi:hypothetical protein
MLFDLQGKRRRVVQATYLTLAVLMGGGLVFFGVGSDATGGLADIFGSSDGGGGSNDTIEKRIDRNEERAGRRGPAQQAALQELVRDYYALASNQVQPTDTSFPEDARDELENAARAWERYVALDPDKPDPATANFALRVYDVPALNQADKAKDAAAIVARSENDWQSYVRVVQYASLAGDTRTADLAGTKAIDVAPKGERKDVERQVKAAKRLGSGAGGSGATTEGG